MSQDYNYLDEQSHEKLNMNLENNEGEMLKVHHSNSLQDNLNQNLNENYIGCSNRDHYHPEIRLVNIQKDLKNNDGSCGFNLSRSKWDPYPWVSAVDKNSPAYNADLKVGDCILEVNGDDILGLRISEIANLVKINSDNLQLLVWSTGRDPKCDENSLCCGPMPLSLERLSASMQTILACLECPVCMDIIPAPVIQCQNGHILCIKCRFKSDKCPVCRQHYSCVRSLISEQIYSAILNAFKLNGIDNNDNNDNNDYNDDNMHMNNIRSTGRKLREKLFGAKYKKKENKTMQQQKQQQQQLLFTETTNFKSTTRETLTASTTTTTKTNNKSASTIGINDTSSYDLNLNKDRMNTLVKEYKNYYGSSGCNINCSDSNTRQLTSTNKFLAKELDLNRTNSLENLSNESHHLVQKDNIKSNGKLKYQIQMDQSSLASNYLKSLNCKDIKQFSQSTNDLSSFSIDNDNNNYNKNIQTSIIAIPRCPSLNPLTERKFSSSSTTQLISLEEQEPSVFTTTRQNKPFVSKSIKLSTSSSSLSPLSVSVLDRQLWYGSLKVLNNNNNNNNNNSFTIGYTDDINGNINTNSCGIIMNTKSKSNVSLSVNNLHSNTITNLNTSSRNGTLILEKRPSPSTASTLFPFVSKSPSTMSSLLQLSSDNVTENVATNESSEEILNIPSKSVENVDFTYTSDFNSDAAVVNQCLTLTVPKINEIKNYHCIDTEEDLNDVENVNKNHENDYICNGISVKIEKDRKLTNDIERFLCPYDCCDDKFNAPSLNEHVKKYHLIPIISFGKNSTEIALPLQEPMNSAIIELNLNENIFWIRIHVKKNGSIIATAFLQGTQDESLEFMLEGQLQNKVDDKLLEKQLITRSIVHSMMMIKMNRISWNNLENRNFIDENEDINNIVAVVADELNTLNYINNNNDNNKSSTSDGSNSNDENLKNLKNCNTIKKNKIKKNNNDNYDKIDFIEYKNNNNVDNVDKSVEKDDDEYNDDNDDDKKQIENVFFDYNSIKSTFNINDNNYKKIALLLKIFVKYK